MPTRKQKVRDQVRALCAETGPDDGVDPREDKRASARSNRKTDRKLGQLCRQVEHTLHLVLGAMPQAEGLLVQAVLPAPNASRLCVVVAAPDEVRKNELAALLERQAGRLRSEVASTITRRRAPELIFRVIVQGGDHG